MTLENMYATRLTNAYYTDANLQVLKPGCLKALKRIFKLCDMNKDGILDASELNEFQVSSDASTPCS